MIKAWMFIFCKAEVPVQSTHKKYFIHLKKLKYN
jgi:hypothetical protein